SVNPERRSEDASPLADVVEQLAQQVSDLRANEAGRSGEVILTPHDEPNIHFPENDHVERIDTHHVTFSEPFSTVPVVTLGFTSLDADNDYNLRVHTYLEHLTTTGFDLSVKEWHNSYNYAVNVMWMACPE
ncbi:hypothetical protein BaRGS_00040316, partial [Batillaria attramentaria]